MSQKQKCSADSAAGLWTTTPLWSVVGLDEDQHPITASITSDNNTSPDTAVFALADPSETPRSVREHILRAKYRKSASGGHAINFVMRLMQGATTIATVTHNDVDESWFMNVYQLTQAEVDAITDYPALTLEVDRGGDTAGQPATRRSLEVAYLQLEVPSQNAGL